MLMPLAQNAIPNLTQQNICLRVHRVRLHYIELIFGQIRSMLPLSFHRFHLSLIFPRSLLPLLLSILVLSFTRPLVLRLLRLLLRLLLLLLLRLPLLLLSLLLPLFPVLLLILLLALPLLHLHHLLPVSILSSSILNWIVTLCRCSTPLHPRRRLPWTRRSTGSWTTFCDVF